MLGRAAGTTEVSDRLPAGVDFAALAGSAAERAEIDNVATLRVGRGRQQQGKEEQSEERRDAVPRVTHDKSSPSGSPLCIRR